MPNYVPRREFFLVVLILGLILVAVPTTALFFGSQLSKQIQGQSELETQGQVQTPPVQGQVGGVATSIASPSINSPAGEVALVKKVIDGDTIELTDGKRVRYIGINTPETVDPRKPVECFGKEASNKNRELVENQTVILEKDISQTDQFGRLLRYVYISGSTVGEEIFVNEYLVREGFAFATSYPPDIKYQDQLRQAQQDAISAKKGLWGSCP